MLEKGKRYRDDRGGETEIGGVCRDYPDWMWGINGNWYDRVTGRMIGYRKVPGTKDDWEHYVQEPSSYDLIEEVPNSD